jgi:hypothetical protein
MTAVLQVAVHRTGTGLDGVTSQRGRSLRAAALRDVRLGAGYALVAGEDPGQPQTVAPRLEVALPTGDATSFAGNGGVTVAPSIALGLRIGSFFAATQQGVRLRSASDLGGLRHGSEVVSLLGLGVDLLGGERLSLALEAWLRPSLVRQQRTTHEGTRVEARLLPAEWMASVGTRLGELRLAVGAGSAVPLSRETRSRSDGSERSDSFAGLTAPRFRALLSARRDFAP